MKLKFIGTGSGKTDEIKYHSSALIKFDEKQLLIDTGDGVVKALYSAQECVLDIDYIVFSHYHADHFSGIASLLTQMKLKKRTKPLTIFTHKYLFEPLERIIEYSYLSPENFNFEFNIKGFSHDMEIPLGEDISFIAKQNSHIQPKPGIKPKFNIEYISSSFLFKLKGRNVVYTADVGCKDDLYLFIDSKADIFITEATHVDMAEIVEASKILKPKEVYINHFNLEDKKYLLSYFQHEHEETENFWLAYDSMEIEIS